jgi:hypothetical protein
MSNNPQNNFLGDPHISSPLDRDLAQNDAPGRFDSNGAAHAATSRPGTNAQNDAFDQGDRSYDEGQNACLDPETWEPGNPGHPESRAALSRRGGIRGPIRPASSRGAAVNLIAALMMVTGFGLLIAAVFGFSATQPLLNLFQKAGLTPGILLMFGMALALITYLISPLRHVHYQIEEFIETSRLSDEQTKADLEFLIESEELANAEQPSREEYLDQVLAAISQQSEKLSNLTQALKMYGKPLGQVSRHVAEVAARTKSNTTDLCMLKQSVQTSFEETSQKITEDMTSIITKIHTSLSGIQTTGSQEDDSLRSDMNAILTAVQDLSDTMPPASEREPGHIGQPLSKPLDTGPEERSPSKPESSPLEGSNVLDAIAKLREMRP